MISGLSPADGTCVTDSTPQICADYSDAVGIDTTSVQIEVDGSDVTSSATVTAGGVCYTPGASMSEGAHTVQVTVSDLCGNENTTSWSFTVDTTLPSISDLSPADGACVTDSTPQICADYSDAGGINTASVLIEVDDVNVTGSATVTGGGVCYTPGSSLSEGVHTVRVNVSDGCGNENTTSWTFTVDLTPPAILFNEPPTPANNSEVTVKSVNISATVTDSGCGVDAATVALIWNGTAYPMLASGSTYYLVMLNLPNGEYAYHVQANDTGGNTRLSTTRYVTVNVTEYSVTLDLVTFYNLISLPVNDPDILTASTLANQIGSNCTEVVKWDTALQQLVSYVIWAPLNNFDLLPGVGYFVNMLGPTTTTFTGDGWASPFNCSLVIGYNYIGIPVNDTSVTDAASLATKIGANCTEVIRWDSATQTFESYIPGVPLNNFPVRRGEGYLANMINPTTVTFAGGPWHD